MPLLAAADLSERRRDVHQQWRAREARFGEADTEQAAHVLILRPIALHERRLFTLKDRLVRADRSELPIVETGHVDREIESRPGPFHPAPGEEQSIDFVRLRAVERRSALDAIPVRQPRVERAV